MENLPNRFDATLRQGATFGPVTFTVADIDLTLHTLVGGVGQTTLTPTLVIVDATHFTATFSSALTSSLTARAATERTARSDTKHAWWVDAVRIADTSFITPVVAGTLSLVAKGGHD